MRASNLILHEVAKLRATAPPLDLGDRSRLLSNLVFMHQLMVAAEPLLELAIEHSEGSLRDYFAQHLEEERGHAPWLADDLANAGVDVKAIAPSRIAVALAGGMYYLIRHVSPLCLLGYMLVLECFPPALADIAELENLHGKDLLRTVRHHAEHDPDHGADLLRIIDTHYSPDILSCAVETVRYLNNFTKEIA